MQIDILTLFPPMFSPLNFSIVKRAVEKKVVTIRVHDLRNWAIDNYKSVDDRPYGGGAGMILRVDTIDRAVSTIKNQNAKIKMQKVILLDATGERYTQAKAQHLTTNQHLIIICGHYEGVDHRVHEHLADEVVSIGDFVLSGGEIPALILVDSIVRLLPGSLGNPESLKEESHGNIQVEYPQYTRPEEYKGWKVPDILLSGDHKKIAEWRKAKQ